MFFKKINLVKQKRMNSTLNLSKKHKKKNYSCEESVKFKDFINNYNIETIDSLKVIRKERKSYLIFMFLLNIVFAYFYLTEFKCLLFYFMQRYI